jgi:hypothetical protein
VRILTKAALRILAWSFFFAVLGTIQSPVSGVLDDIANALGVIALIDLLVSVMLAVEITCRESREEMRAAPPVPDLTDQEWLLTLPPIHYHEDPPEYFRGPRGIRMMSTNLYAGVDGDCDRCPEDGPWVTRSYPDPAELRAGHDARLRQAEAGRIMAVELATPRRVQRPCPRCALFPCRCP